MLTGKTFKLTTTLVSLFFVLCVVNTVMSSDDARMEKAVQFLEQYGWMLEKQVSTAKKNVTQVMANKKAVAPINLAPANPELATSFQQEINQSIEYGLNWLRYIWAEYGDWGTHSCLAGGAGLGALAFLEHGISETDPTVAAAIDYLLNSQHEDGSWWTNSDYKLYETSCVVMALAATRNPDYQDEIRNGVNYIINSCQYFGEEDPDSVGGFGGEGYFYQYADLSNTQFALMALRASGETIPNKVWEDTIKYVNRCQTPDGGFIYRPNGNEYFSGYSYGSMTGAGIWSLRLCGVNIGDSHIQSALKWFSDNYEYQFNPTTNPDMQQSTEWFHYYLWSAAKPFLLTKPDSDNVGGKSNPSDYGYSGENRSWYFDFAYHLINTQIMSDSDMGYWENTGGGEIACTAFALLVLEKATVLPHAVSISISPEVLKQEICSEAKFTVTVKNIGKVTDSYNIAVGNLPKCLEVGINSTVEKLAPDKSVDLVLKIEQSSTGTQPCGCDEKNPCVFSVTATSQTNPTLSNSTAKATLELTPCEPGEENCTATFVVTGIVSEEDGKTPLSGVAAVTVKNVTKNTAQTGKTGSTGIPGGYSVTFIDTQTNAAACIGDEIEVIVSLNDRSGESRYIVLKSAVDANKAEINVVISSSDCSGTFVVDYAKGINMISVPLDPGATWRMSDLLKHIGPEASMVIWYDKGAEKFSTFMPKFSTNSPANATINGGEGYILMMTKAKKVTYEGKAWQNVSAIPSPTVVLSEGNDLTTPVFAVTGLIKGQNGLYIDGIKVTVCNLNTGQKATAFTGTTAGQGRYVVTLADFTGGIAAQLDDTFSITVEASPTGFANENVKLKVNRDDIQAANVMFDLILEPLPAKTSLLQNYPNPFNPETWLPYKLAKDATVTISIYNAHGQIIRTIALGEKSAGVYLGKDKAAYWDGRDSSGEKVSSGLYFYTMRAGEFRTTRKMVIVK
ncbi:T9SS type A sorting domain-containing protein [Candidatus Poribacteria bacterium]|nr:T9SS type A sorting domain-containing protein [Candidatus Poribacteria bacterium]